MVYRLTDRFLRYRHFWRDEAFNELNELYVAVLFRSLSIGMSGIFVPLYMLKLGYSVFEICLVMAWFFTFRIILDIVAGYSVARYGPKHTLVIGYLLLLVSTSLFTMLAYIAWPLWLLGGLWGASMSFFFIPFHVDFSKVKHRLHSGKELGYVHIVERIGMALGPLIGAFVASIYGGQFAFGLSAVVLLAGLFPLFATPEPTRTKQHLDYKNFNVSKHLRDYFTYAALTVENQASLTFWPLYLGAFVLVGGTAYAGLGFLASTSVIVAILAARTYGRYLDKGFGGRILQTNAAITVLIQIFRPMINIYPMALVSNLASEITRVGLRMSYYKGLYDKADNLSGYRIVYLSSLEAFASIVKAAFWWLLAIIGFTYGGKTIFIIGFSITALAGGIVMLARLPSLKPVRHIIES